MEMASDPRTVLCPEEASGQPRRPLNGKPSSIQMSCREPGAWRATEFPNKKGRVAVSLPSLGTFGIAKL